MMMTLGAHLPPGLLDRAQSWLRREVGCLVGRVEQAKDRVAVAAITSRCDLAEVRAQFGDKLASGEAASCLVLVEPGNDALGRLPVGELVRYLDERYFTGADTTDVTARRVEAAEAVTYSLTYDLRCPVTHVDTAFRDFDQVAFYPQAIDKNDPLYDPSMFAPFVCMNITSDVYGFAMLAEDFRKHGAKLNCSFGSLLKTERHEVYDAALRQFQRLAERTIENYARDTDPAVLTPISLTQGCTHYIAQHDESAFLETIKRPFRNEMPSQYVPRIIAQWEAYFDHGVEPDMSGVYAASVPL
jgi:hypothetical protein